MNAFNTFKTSLEWTYKNDSDEKDSYKSMLNSFVKHGTEMSFLTKELIMNGHDLTGPGGMYGITALDDYIKPTEKYILFDLCLKIGKKIAKLNKPILPLKHNSVTNFYSNLQFSPVLEEELNCQKVVNYMVKNILDIMEREPHFSFCTMYVQKRYKRLSEFKTKEYTKTMFRFVTGPYQF